MRTFRQKLFALASASALALAGCAGSTGPQGPSGPGGASTGTLSGKVTIANTSPALAVVGATVTLSPAVTGVTIVTDSSGNYSAVVPIGVYSLTFAATNFASQTKSVSVTAGSTPTTQNVSLVPTAPVVVTIAVTGSATPGATVSAAGTVVPLDGSTVTSQTWSLVSGAPVTFSAASALTTNVTLGSAADYKVQLFKALTVSPLQELDADPSVGGLEGTPFLGGLKDRFAVQAINHFDVERAGEVTLQLQVTTSTGTYSATKLLSTALPWGVASAVAAVPTGQAVVIHGKCLNPDVNGVCVGPYSYALTGPSGSTAALDDAANQNPAFTPDVAGTYTLNEATSGVTLTISARTWVGAIDAAATSAGLVNGVGNPVGNSTCLLCHAPGGGGPAPDMFTPWSKSGHASIFTQNVNAGGHYGEACFDCHTVGWNKSVTNGGIDEKSDYAAMLSGIFTNNGSPVANPLNWKNILTNYPNTAAMANIQCENCHGPNSGHSGAAAEVPLRVSMDAGVCARCHGEPARHGRYQEWQLAGHANYNTAVGEGFDSTGAIRTTCAGCHTAQGFLKWVAQLQGGNASRTLTAASITALTGVMTPTTVQPQTCAVCHDPHDAGTVSSLGTDAKLRVMDSTPLLPGGFMAIGVGKGALCITCHNSRNGEAVAGSGIVNLHEDGNAVFGTLTAYSAPHEACQGDVLMGRNAYFVQGVRSAHSNIPDTCTKCHMESVPAPPELGYPTQTNHTFEANLTICANCHGSFDGSGVQSSVSAELAALKAAIEAAVKRVYATAATTVVYNPGRSPTLTIDGVTSNFTVIVPVAANPINTDLFAKANWNYELVDTDASKGVHNPSFIHEVLYATITTMNGITTAQ